MRYLNRNRKQLAQLEKELNIELSIIAEVRSEVGFVPENSLTHRKDLAEVRQVLRAFVIERDYEIELQVLLMKETARRMSNGHPRIEKMVYEYMMHFGMLLAVERKYIEERARKAG